MTWSGLCSESVLQMGMGERGISHKFVLIISLLLLSCGMRLSSHKFDPGIFVLVLFFLSAYNDGCFCIPVLWLLSPPISFRGAKDELCCWAGQQRWIMKGKEVPEGWPSPLQRTSKVRSL